ncbi:MAG: ABC transporter ATP-binding protein [Peptococcaceae bacterium BRH_c4b]|nr:MAG: ABC transporter ATP-binding protein [Peptococcaceae bacterium BRH_c4b]
MSSDIAISVKKINKCYFIYDRPQDRLKQGFFRNRKYYREFWALKDVSFQVSKGETVGIIGRNGSGKSTLLQIIAGTLTPTFGEVKVSGRVAALLELGSGFNPDFTGRENVFMNGAILGIKKDEMEKRFEDIVDFADIGDFIDQPVKVYSSGMVLRLAFAVQAMVPKEILIVDEALAVGDELFQRKCFAKIEDFKKHGGTILFVSHDGSAVTQLCDRSLLLDGGEELIFGQSKQVLNLYQKLMYAPPDKAQQVRNEISNIALNTNTEQQLKASRRVHTDKSTDVTLENGECTPDVVTEPAYSPGLVSDSVVNYESQGADVSNVEILTLQGKKVNILVPNRQYVYKYEVYFDKDCHNVRFGMLIKTLNGQELGGAVTAMSGKGIPYIQAGSIIRVEFQFKAMLTPGTYFLNAGVLELTSNEEIYLCRALDVSVFKVAVADNQLMTGTIDFGIIPQVYLMKDTNERVSYA